MHRTRICQANLQGEGERGRGRGAGRKGVPGEGGGRGDGSGEGAERGRVPREGVTGGKKGRWREKEREKIMFNQLLLFPNTLEKKIT